MKKKKISRVSAADIAQAAGVSKSTVGYVLRNQAGPSRETRERVQKVAQKLGYVPDARIASWMARVRGAKSKEFLPIAWLNTNVERDAWHKYSFLSPLLEGARERCEQLGYRLEEIWALQPGMTMKRTAAILYQRGIEGVIVTPRATHVRLNWNNLAGVALGAELLAPQLHRVGPDVTFNLLLTLKLVKRFGYQRIGICLTDVFDRATHRVVSAMAYHFAATAPASKAVAPLFYSSMGDERAIAERQFRAWLGQHKPDVIVGHDFRLVRWVEAAGYAVPQKMGIVHLALDDDVLDWSGIYSNRRQMGRTAAELVISLVQNRQFGAPKVAMETTVRGCWRQGRTLLIPKPK
jgi:LacI family transcriptional regulator